LFSPSDLTSPEDLPANRVTEVSGDNYL
jgi:hypothetical protein